MTMRWVVIFECRAGTGHNEWETARPPTLEEAVSLLNAIDHGYDPTSKYPYISPRAIRAQ